MPFPGGEDSRVPHAHLHEGRHAHSGRRRGAPAPSATSAFAPQPAPTRLHEDVRPCPSAQTHCAPPHPPHPLPLQARPCAQEAGDERRATLRFVPDARPVHLTPPTPADTGALPPRAALPEPDAPTADAQFSTCISLGEGELGGLLQSDPRFSSLACVATEAVSPWRILAVNRAWSEATGYSAAEAIGQSCGMLQGPGTCADALRALKRACEELSPICLRLLNYDQRGRAFLNMLRVAPAFRSAGAAPACMIGSLTREALPAHLQAGAASIHAAPRVEVAPPVVVAETDGRRHTIPSPPPPTAAAAGIMPPPPTPTQRVVFASAASPPLSRKAVLNAALDQLPASSLTAWDVSAQEPSCEARMAMLRPLGGQAGSAIEIPRGVSPPPSAVARAPNRWPTQPATGTPLRTDSTPPPALDSLAISPRRSSVPSLSEHRSMSGLSEFSEASDNDSPHGYGDGTGHAAPVPTHAAAAGRPAPFLTKVQQILDWPPAAVAVHWAMAADGSPAFVIVDQATFAKEVLPRFYKHNKISSFVQQLYTYGFRRADLPSPEALAAPPSLDETDCAVTCRSSLAFQHPLFLPHRLDLLSHIKRAGPSRPGLADPSPGSALALSEAKEADASAVRELDQVEQTILALEAAHKLKVCADERRIEMLWQMVQLRKRDAIAAEAKAPLGARVAAAWTAPGGTAVGAQPARAADQPVAGGCAGWPAAERVTGGEVSPATAAAARRDPARADSLLPTGGSKPVPAPARQPSGSAPPPGYTNLSDAGCQAGHGFDRVSPESVSTMSVARTQSVSADDDLVGAESSDSAESLSGSTHTDAASTSAIDSYSRSDASSVHDDSMRFEGGKRREGAPDHTVGDKRSAPLQQSVGGSGEGEPAGDASGRERHRDARRRLSGDAKGVPAGGECHGARTGDSRKRQVAQRASSPHDSIEF